VRGGLTSTALLVLIAIVGTTVAPWQLFFQQSNVIDKRITPHWIGSERLDTIIGAFVTNITAAGLMVAAAFAFAHTPYDGHFVNIGATATALAQTISPALGVMLALILLNASIIGACAVTLSTSYAFGDVFGVKHSLHRRFSEAKVFYGSFVTMIVAAGMVVLLSTPPIQALMILGVQALAGILLPSATVFLLLLCNDTAVLGPWVNKPWLNAVAAVIIGVLVELSLILAVTTFFPEIDANRLTLVLSAILVAALLAMGLVTLVQRQLRSRHNPDPDVQALTQADRDTWRMPPLSELTPPVWSAARKVGMLTLRGYLLIAAAMMVVKVVELALGH